MTRPGIEPRSPRPLAKTLTIIPMSGEGAVIHQKVKNNITPISLFSVSPVNWGCEIH